MMQKKSAFDILMNRTNRPKDTEKPDLNRSLNNDLNTSQVCIILNETTSVDNSTSVTNSSIITSSSTSTQSVIEEKPFNPCFLQHTRQYKDDDVKFLKSNSLNSESKFKSGNKEQSVENMLRKLDLQKPLRFDFIEQAKPFNPCNCKSTDSNDFENYAKEITFSLNNSYSLDNTIIEVFTNLTPNVIQEAISKVEETVNKVEQSEPIELEKREESVSVVKTKLADSVASPVALITSPCLSDSPVQSRYPKRRKTETQQPTAPSPLKSENGRRRSKKEEQQKMQKIVEEKETEPTASVKRSTSNEVLKVAKKELNEELLWTEKYQFKSENDIVTNNSQLERLKEWLNNRKAILSKDSGNPSSTKAGGKSTWYDSDSDYSCDSDFSNADSCSSNKVNGRKFYSNAILLSGPHGCGKTSSIYSVAKQLGFKIFEVNSSSLRCKSQIIQELEGALNSHHVSNNNNFNMPSGLFSNSPAHSSASEAASFKIEKFFQSTDKAAKPNEPAAMPVVKSIQSFFLKPVKAETPPPIQAAALVKEPPLMVNTDDSEDSGSDAAYESRLKTRRKKRKNSLRRETVLTVHHSKKPMLGIQETVYMCTPSKITTSVKIHTESLILFDEIDVVFKEDVGFFAAINHFIKKSRKPIVLTTNDNFLQDKINLNVEKIQFAQPRVDASVKFLKNIATLERSDLNTATAYKIIHDCKCDMRRALVQLQALIGSGNQNHSFMQIYKQHATSTLDLNKHLNRYIFSACAYHNDLQFFETLFSLDSLSKRLANLFTLDCNNLNPTLNLENLTYDLFLIRDGLTDNSNSSAGNVAFNPFLLQPPAQNNSDIDLAVNRSSDLVRFNTTYLKDELLDFYDNFIVLFNENHIEFNDWCKHGRVNRFGFGSSGCLNRFAQNTFRFTSNSALSLEFRPFLHMICRAEEARQLANGKRRFMHYLGNSFAGLNREDFALLSQSNLVKDCEKTNDEVTSTINQIGIKCDSNKNSDLYSDDA